MIQSGYRCAPVALVLAVALFGLAGCSGGSAAVQGTVTLDGAPVDGGAISFTPSGKPDSASFGAQIVGGKYSITGKAPPPGSYRVDVHWNKPTGKKVPTPGDPGTTMDQTAEAIPPTYNKNSTLKADLKSGSNTVDFDLKSK
jgi:hypothetical protein